MPFSSTHCPVLARSWRLPSWPSLVTTATASPPPTLQALAGTCPVTQQSGKRKIVFFRWGCNREFRRIVQQLARASISQSGWASAYWHQIRSRCRSDSDAYRRLGNRWLAIIWKMWQDRKAYDETYHLQQRARRRRPKA
jgi:hypothetical protein